MTSEPLFAIAVLAALIAISEWLVRHTWLRHLGSALLVIVLAAVASNTGVVPPYDADNPVYGAIFSDVAPLGIFWLLLGVELRALWRAGPPLLILFAIGAIGTTIGVFCGMALAGGAETFGPLHYALGGMFVGTYTGGSINFNAVALDYGVMENGTLYAGATAIDAALTTVWMAATVAIPRLLAPYWSQARAVRTVELRSEPTATEDSSVSLIDIAVLIALGAAAVWGARAASLLLDESAGIAVPEVLVVTTVALLLAQVPTVARLRGASLLGLLAVYFFLAVIGVLCDLQAVAAIGELATSFAILAGTAVAVHGIVIFGTAFLLRLDVAAAAVASQANIGGSASALALARSLGRTDLTLPAILIGALGTALGNYLGFSAAAVLA